MRKDVNPDKVLSSTPSRQEEVMAVCSTKATAFLYMRSSPAGKYDGTIQCRERLGGLLKYYEREAA